MRPLNTRAYQSEPLSLDQRNAAEEDANERRCSNLPRQRATPPALECIRRVGADFQHVKEFDGKSRPDAGRADETSHEWVREHPIPKTARTPIPCRMF